MKRLLRALVGVAVMTVAAASSLADDDWVNRATVSMTNAPPNSPAARLRLLLVGDVARLPG